MFVFTVLTKKKHTDIRDDNTKQRETIILGTIYGSVIVLSERHPWGKYFIISYYGKKVETVMVINSTNNNKTNNHLPS